MLLINRFFSILKVCGWRFNFLFLNLAQISILSLGFLFLVLGGFLGGGVLENCYPSKSLSVTLTSIGFVSKLSPPLFGEYLWGEKKSTNCQILNFQTKIIYFYSLIARNVWECLLLYARDCEQIFRNCTSLVEILFQLPSVRGTNRRGVTLIGTQRRECLEVRH